MISIERPSEDARIALQVRLDMVKTQAERNRLGQFATPTALARDIVSHALSLLSPDQSIRYLEPGFGTGAFYSALLDAVHERPVEHARGFELDDHYRAQAASLWASTPLELTHGDFTCINPPSEHTDRYSLIICNPPYVRHHHIEFGNKDRLRAATAKASGMKLVGLAGLYCHFLGLSHTWMKRGALAVWLIPSEFMDVNYGKAVKDYLLRRVTLLRIHRFDPNDVQFADALVSSAVVIFRNDPPTANLAVDFTYGGELTDPHCFRRVTAATLATETKWTRFPLAEERPELAHSETRVPKLSDFFIVRRGIATGNNKFFILSEQNINLHGLPIECFRPILPSPRHLSLEVVPTNPDGTPDIDNRLFLLDCSLPEEEIATRYPKLATYLESGKRQNVSETYLCRHRKPWYSQEQRPVAPFICTYIGRGDAKNGKPFRFILNHSVAIVSNVYLLLYPKSPIAQLIADKPTFKIAVWRALSELSPTSMLQEGRVYGGGLHKMEPSELGNVPASSIAALILRANEFPTFESASGAPVSASPKHRLSKKDIQETLQPHLEIWERRPGYTSSK